MLSNRRWESGRTLKLGKPSAALAMLGLCLCAFSSTAAAQTLEERVAALESLLLGERVAALESLLSQQTAAAQTLEARVAALESLRITQEAEIRDLFLQAIQVQDQLHQWDVVLAGVSRAGNELYFDGLNVNVRNGTGSTTDSPNGLGNLVIGYNEPRPGECDPAGGACRGGSHNVVVGPEHDYVSFAAVVAGRHNAASGPFAAVFGDHNEASGFGATVSGGRDNRATGDSASVSGGLQNTASGDSSAVSGGTQRSAPGPFDWRAGRLFSPF